jgi:diguanylate cyclase (GGDEF)-like protein
MAKGDFVCRMGGDEFMALVSDFNNEQEIQNIMQRVIASVTTPIQIDGKQIDISVSLGYAFYPDDSTLKSDLIHLADMAMYKVKTTHKGLAKRYIKKSSANS